MEDAASSLYISENLIPPSGSTVDITPLSDSTFPHWLQGGHRSNHVLRHGRSIHLATVRMLHLLPGQLRIVLHMNHVTIRASRNGNWSPGCPPPPSDCILFFRSHVFGGGLSHGSTYMELHYIPHQPLHVAQLYNTSGFSSASVSWGALRHGHCGFPQCK